MNPEPLSKTPVRQVLSPMRGELLSKPCTPNLSWPHPEQRAQSVRAQSAAPQLTSACGPRSQQRSRPGSRIRTPQGDGGVIHLYPSPKPPTPIASALFRSPSQLPVVPQQLTKTPSPLPQMNNNNVDHLSPADQVQMRRQSPAAISWPTPKLAQSPKVAQAVY